MTLTLAWWHLFAITTVIALAWSLNPIPGDTWGMAGMFRFFGAVIGSLLLWLGYFAGRFVMG